MKILITGSEGFIGSHLVEKLIKQGHEVTGLVMYNSFNTWGWLDTLSKDIRKEINIVTGDIRDEYLVNKIVKKKIDIVINLAALIGIPYSYRAPKSYFDTNVNGTINILNASINSNVKKIIHTSTSEVYGTPKTVPITETHIVSAQSPYAASKIAADQVALSYFKSYNLPVTILRPFNTFGPRQSARAIIPTIITQTLNKREIKLGSLHPTRDFTYVEDTVEAFFLSIKNKNDYGEIINIGSGFEISIEKLANKISSLMGKKIKITSEKSRIRPKKSELERLFASSKKAKKILNWKPKHASRKGFEKGLLKTIQWFSNHDNLKNYKSNIFNV